MRANIRVILFAAILGIVCSLLLAGATQIFGPLREANEKAEEVRNYLSALEIPVADPNDAQALVDIFNENIRVAEVGDLVIYEYVSGSSGDNQAIAYAVPFSGAGLWGPVFGVLALEADSETVRGVRFYKQEDTPGLGGEIGADWFQRQFVGKKLVSRSGNPGFVVSKPGASNDQNEVDGITGATMTSARVGGMIDQLAKKLAQERN